MSIFTKIGEAQKFFKEAGINLESIFDLFTGKASGKKVAQTLTPLLIKVSPAIGKAIDHLEAQYAGHGSDDARHRIRCYLVISKEQDEVGRPLEALSVCKVNSHTGQMEFLETIPFYQVANYITDKIVPQEKLHVSDSENSSEQKLIA